MTAITIKGICIKDLSMSREPDGKLKIHGNYELVASNDMVLAKQQFGPEHYGVLYTPSPDSNQAFHAIFANVAKDISSNLGLPT